MLSRKLSSIALIFFAAMIAIGCGPNQEPTETGTKGTINISVDESLKPVIEQQLKVWDSSYPEGHIHVRYLPENECFDNLYKDSARLIITARDITAGEKSAYASAKISLRSLSMAEDAIAIILNPASPDTFMTLGQLREILLGKFARTYTVVFDNGKSSMVRFVVDSLIPGGQLSSKSYAASTNEGVIDYVAKNPEAIGIVGVSHIYDPQDNTGMGRFLPNIKVAALRNDSTLEFHQPYQYSIALHKYPLTRKVYFVSRESWQGLGTGFANFLCGEQGQLIFKKSWMVPLRVPLVIREVQLK